jgi:hypothetical protein
MHQVSGQVAVIGQEQQAVAVEVQPPDRVHPSLDGPDEVHDRRPALRVGDRRDAAAGLVERDHDRRIGPGADPLAVDLDGVAGGIDPGPERTLYRLDFKLSFGRLVAKLRGAADGPVDRRDPADLGKPPA